MSLCAFDTYSDKGRMILTRIRREREGRAGMKYMGEYYAKQPTFDLHVLRSKKFNRLTRLQNEASTYLNMQERKTLRQQISWIDAELESRRLQIPLAF